MAERNEVKTDPVIKDGTALLSELSLRVCLSRVAVLGVLLSHANVNIPTCNGETLSRFCCGLTVDREGSTVLHNCFFYPSEWADSVSWGVGPGINSLTLCALIRMWW